MSMLIVTRISAPNLKFLNKIPSYLSFVKQVSLMAFLDFENLQVSLKTDILTRALIACVKLYTSIPHVPPR